MIDTDTVVVDASIVIKWVLYETDTIIARTLLASWIDNGKVILAPSLLAYEITNSLYQKVRKGEITLEDAILGLTKALGTGLVLHFSETTAKSATLSSKAMELASQFNLPATYDAHYLALAQEQSCELWTADTKMWRAVKGQLNWVRWLGDYSTP